MDERSIITHKQGNKRCCFFLSCSSRGGFGNFIVVQELQRRARELMHFKLSADDLVQLQEASASMQEFLSDPRNLEAVEQAQSQLRMLRNALAHGAGASAPSLPRPAYRLDGDDHG